MKIVAFSDLIVSGLDLLFVNFGKLVLVLVHTLGCFVFVWLVVCLFGWFVGGLVICFRATCRWRTKDAMDAAERLVRRMKTIDFANGILKRSSKTTIFQLFLKVSGIFFRVVGTFLGVLVRFVLKANVH